MDNETQPLESTRVSYEDDDWDDDRGGRGRVLWGRVVALFIALLLAFFAGRLTGNGGGGIPVSQYSKVKRELVAARASISSQQAAPAPAATGPAASPSPSAATTPTAGQKTYTVKAGDTLRDIAIKFYGDPSLVTLIESANHITDPTLVHQGTKLIIPPKP
jgi:nucleoid-associated protein YgaU